MGFSIFFPAFSASSDVWLSHWTELPQQQKKETKNVIIYSGIVGGCALLVFVRAFAVFHAALRSSKMLHKRYASPSPGYFRSFILARFCPCYTFLRISLPIQISCHGHYVLVQLNPDLANSIKHASG